MIKSYIICTTPRSGSTLLCKLLASTGRTGNPDSFYHRAEFMREWAVEWGLAESGRVSGPDFDTAYLTAAIKAGKAGTDIFGLRLQHDYLGLLSETLGRVYPGLPSDAHRFARAFGDSLYIHLTRSDKVAQAVSLVKAQQSGLWHVNADGTELERQAAPQEPVYSFQSIHREVVDLQRDDDAWAAWFDRHHIHPLLVSYETFADHPAETIIGICNSLGVAPPKAETITPPLAKLSDDISLDWISRYKRDLAESAR